MNITRANALAETVVPEPRRAFDFRSRFQFGRLTRQQCPASIGKMPDAELGCDIIANVMLQNMNLSWNLSAALMGAHTIGLASPERSGYSGAWSDANSSRRFDNGYYTSIVLKGWAPDPVVEGNPEKNQWKRIDIGTDTMGLGREMMLDTD